MNSKIDGRIVNDINHLQSKRAEEIQDAPIHLSCRNICFSRDHIPIFKDLSLDIPRHQVTCLMGPSGTGKTTLLRMMAGILSPDRGHVFCDGYALHEQSQLDRMNHRKSIGFLFQNSALFTNLSVLDNVAFPLREMTNVPETLIRIVAMMKLEGVGLRGAASLMPSQLSGGMMRRVALARSLALDPCIMMYDEPFSGLDPIASAVIARLIVNINQALKITSIVVTHDIAQAMQFAQHLCFIADGQCIAQGSAQSIRQHKDDRLHQFIQGVHVDGAHFNYPSDLTYQEDLASLCDFDIE